MFTKFPSIERFSDIVVRADHFDLDKVTYKVKIKLHGTNAGLRFENGKWIAQNRSRDLTLEDSNYGYAEFVSELKQPLNQFEGTFFGEWAGPGIQAGDAVTKIPGKHLFIYAYVDPENILMDDPSQIEILLVKVFGEVPARIKVLPWTDIETTFDVKDKEGMQVQIDELKTQLENTVGNIDPFIKDEFNLEGPGEGWVFYPCGDLTPYWRDYLWKMKTERHAEVKTKRIRVTPKKPEGVDEFVQMFFTEARMEKLLNEHMGGVADRKNTGTWLKLIMSDVNKESGNEIAKAEFEWKDVSKYGSSAARTWFFKKCDTL